MQKPISVCLVLTATLLAGCAWFRAKEKNELVGTWTNPLGTVWAIRPNGTFDVDLTHRGRREAWGTWSVQGDEVTLQRTGGLNPKGCDGPAVYKFKRTDQGLQFTLVSDKCKLRKKNVLQPWTPWKKT
ncbi:MAG TPA: hypothetical protein VKE30_02695 [Chthoniobacterales bacterium]|nr:hypothetical protein [Chthoniobacterales bacterium]